MGDFYEDIGGGGEDGDREVVRKTENGRWEAGCGVGEGFHCASWAGLVVGGFHGVW